GLRAPELGLAQLIELNQALRLGHPGSAARPLPQLGFDAGGPPVHVRDLLHYLTQGLIAGPGPLAWGRPFHPRAGAPGLVPYADADARLGHGEHCQLLSYACVHLADQAPTALPAGVFASGAERVLFEFGAGIGLNQTVNNPMWVPSPEQAE